MCQHTSFYTEEQLIAMAFGQGSQQSNAEQIRSSHLYSRHYNNNVERHRLGNFIGLPIKKKNIEEKPNKARRESSKGMEN